jgi:ubiquinone biosynthesis protein
MERIDGVRIDDIDALDSMGIDRKELAMKGVNAYFKMIFEHGFFHADPHPGNIFVMDDGRIGLVDFGIVGWLTPEMIEYLAEAFMAIINKDYDRIVDIYIDLGLVSEKMDIDVFRREFRSDIAYLLEPLYDITISEVDFSEYVEALMRLIVKHHLKVPSDLLLMNRTILIVDNIGRALDPDFNIISAARPYAAELIKKRLSPERMLSKARDSLIEVGDLLIDTPRQVNRLVKKTLRDEVTIKIDPVGMERLILDIDRSSNRIAFSLVVAAIIIGSSMLVQSDIGGKIFGLSTVGATGFLIAFILGLRLLISILKSGRL